MDILTDNQSFMNFRGSKINHKSIGFVPTMGYLHDGHLSLIKQSKLKNEITLCSIFVNPLQFNNPEDFEKYPSNIDNDLKLLTNAGCDAVFLPKNEEFYAKKPVLSFDFGNLDNIMEGYFRPKHFSGVGIVVAKLLNIVKPNEVFLGQKDFQQCLVIKALIEDLNIPTKITICNIVREKNGLAMSSRNSRLSKVAREDASIIYKTLIEAQNLYFANYEPKEIINQIKTKLEQNEKLKLEYFTIADTETLQSYPAWNQYQSGFGFFIALYIEGVRLIDNLIINQK